jgi:hypothetical protein
MAFPARAARRLERRTRTARRIGFGRGDLMQRGSVLRGSGGDRFCVLCVVTCALALAGVVEAAPGGVCLDKGMRAYELRFLEITPAGPIESGGSPVVALGTAALDADGLAKLAARFGGKQAVGMAWGYLLAAAPGEDVKFHGDVPAPWGRRISVHGGPGSDPARHALSIETADTKAVVELGDGETRAFLAAESQKGRVVALITAGPCGPVGLIGAAAGACAANALAGVVPPALVSNPTQSKPGTHRYVNVDVSGRGLVRFVVAEDGAVRDPLLMVDRMTAAEVARALAMTMEGRQYTPATTEGRPVAYCVVDVVAPFSGPMGPRSAPTAP